MVMERLTYLVEAGCFFLFIWVTISILCGSVCGKKKKKEEARTDNIKNARNRF
jgi:hypothetical protein